MPEGGVLAFDFGEQRIGVAVGESLLGIAHPLLTIDSAENQQRFTIIEQLIQEWQVKQLVVGLPLHSDGQEHQLTSLSRRFAQRLHGRFALPVWLVDERYTSLLAESMLNEAGVRGRKQKPALDQVAAQAILQSWFEQGGIAI